MIDPSEITTARNALGRLLAKYREAAGLFQHQLAPHTHYCRSTIANVETGRQHVPRAFWERCEQALGADGALLAAADQLEDLIRRQREETRQLADIQRERQQRQPGAASAGSFDQLDALVQWRRQETAELADAEQEPDSVGLTWAGDVDGARSRASELWSESDDYSVALSVDGAVRAGSRAVAFKWLVGPRDAHVARPDGAGQVTLDDVMAVHAMRRSLTDLDDKHGGGVVLPMAMAYLRSEVTPLLHGRYDSRVGQQLFAAAAQVAVTAGWLAYDSGSQGQARRLMLHALRLAHVADDRLLGGYILAVMSHQALYLGHVTDAVDLARAARTGAGAAAPAVGAVIFAAAEARAHAVAGDKASCLRLMSAAERAHAKVVPAGRPDWLGFLDEAELAGKFGRCFRDLGLHREAEQHLGTSLNLHKARYPRSQPITRIIYATNCVRGR